MESYEKITDRPTLSACMIVKNEEKFLSQCLDSIKDVVDEIIIVDTGSTDNTVEMARRYTDKVYFHEWQNSFSEARNYALQFATCEWILQIDADEKLEQEDVPLLRAVLKHKEFNSIFVALMSELPEGISKSYFQRIYRRGKAHYEGIVHNQLICEGDALITEIRIHHYGYNLSEDKMKAKYKRTESLLKQQLAENPNNVFAWMNLIRIYKCQKLWESAVKTAEHVFDTIKNIDPTSYQMIMYDMGFSLFMMDQYERSEKVCMELIKNYPDNLDGQFLAGGINLYKKDFRKAIYHYMNYIDLIEKKKDKSSEFTLLIVDTYGSHADAWNNIGYCYVELGDYERALMAIRKAISCNNKNINYYENMARVFIKQNKLDKVIDLLKEVISLGIDTSRTHSQIGDIYRIRGNISLAEYHFRKALEMDKNNIGNYTDLGEILIMKGQLQEAESIFKSAFELDRNNIRVLHGLARVSGKKEYIKVILESEKVSSNRFMDMGNDWARMGDFQTAILFYERTLKLDPNNIDALINMSTCYAELGNYDSAFIGYRSALSRRPNDPTIINNLITMQRAIESSIAKISSGT